MNLKQLLSVASQIAKEKELDLDKVVEIIEDSIAVAYRKEYGHKGEVIRAELDKKTGELKFWQVKEVVDKSTVLAEDEKGKEEEQTDLSLEDQPKLPRYHPEKHIWLEEAQAIKPGIDVGEKLESPLQPKDDFGRIAAQSAKQVILQKFRQAEKESVLKEYKSKEGQIVSGIINRFDRGNVFVELGRVSGIMFSSESIPGEHYRVNERMRFYVMEVQEDFRGQPGIILSRAHPQFVSKLFEMEVPEIAEGLVEIKASAREPGFRTKIAVETKSENIDAVGSCVGQRGTRVMAVTNELGQEKIDIIEWSEDPIKFIASSLSPAKAKSVEILSSSEALVLVGEDQLSLAIGSGGQNVRLAARLTGFKIDIRSEIRPEEAQKDGVAEVAVEETEEKDKIEENKIIPKYTDED